METVRPERSSRSSRVTPGFPSLQHVVAQPVDHRPQAFEPLNNAFETHDVRQAIGQMTALKVQQLPGVLGGAAHQSRDVRSFVSMIGRNFLQQRPSTCSSTAAKCSRNSQMTVAMAFCVSRCIFTFRLM